MVPKRQLDGTWVYPPIGAALATVGLDEIRVYIDPQYNTAAQYITTHHMMNLCLASDRRPGMQLLRRWWEHHSLDILGIRAGHAAAEMGEETGMEESEGEGG